MSGTLFLAGIFTFLVVAFLLAGTLVLIGAGTSYRRPEPEKTVPYECGELPVVPTKKAKFSANYYPFAIAFLIFDVEAALLVPWAVLSASAGLKSVVAGAVFLLLLLFGLFYAFKQGALRWE
jgi:NADH-quinone oxidoreductase subunit A